ncbi:MAG: PilZ domain-containing protein [Betaproteobacteria bacterium]
MAVERRKDPRLGMSVPVRVQGFDPDGREWQEMTATDDASYGGASFSLKHAHNVGQVVLLSLPLPSNFRRYSLAETSYKTYALIRGVRAPGREGARVGVMFLGRTPPRGFQDNPGGRYFLPGDQVEEPVQHGERRRHERLALFVNVRVQRTTGDGGEERTVTENLSRGGARVPSTLPVAAGDVVVVSDPAGKASASAVVCNVFVGADRVARLNLQFPDSGAFERLLLAAGAPPLPE